MKIVAFSDIHGQHSRKLKRWFYYNPGDILLFAGDLQLNNHDYGESFVEWVHKLPFTYKVLIFGNHDGNYMHTKEYKINQGYEDIIFLNNESIIIEGIKIYGSPYSVSIPAHAWWFSEPDEILEKIWSDIPDDTNILITHCPPFGILDETIDNSLVGSKTLVKKVFELKELKYHIFGHIQESYGIKEIEGITFINASVLDAEYHMSNLPITFDYNIEEEYNVAE